MAHPNVSHPNRPFRNASPPPATKLSSAIAALFNDSRRCVMRRFGNSSNNQYFLALGGINDVSTASNSNFGSSASGAKYAFVVFSQFLSSRSGKSGL
jgi:hypothetical protein